MADGTSVLVVCLDNHLCGSLPDCLFVYNCTEVVYVFSHPRREDKVRDMTEGHVSPISVGKGVTVSTGRDYPRRTKGVT